MQNETVVTLAKSTAVNLFSRKIGNTIYPVSVSFSETCGESITDKILRLAASEPNQRGPDSKLSVAK